MCNSIIDLLSGTCLGLDGFMFTYDTLTTWRIYCPSSSWSETQDFVTASHAWISRKARQLLQWLRLCVTVYVNLHHCRYDLDGWTRQSHQASINVDKVTKSECIIHVNIADAMILGMSETDNMMHVLEVVPTQHFSLKAGPKRFWQGWWNSTVTKELT